MNDLNIELNGLKIFYRTAGDRNNPVLLFLHAWGAQDEWLPPVVEALSRNFYVIAPEHSGLISSETPDAESSFEWRAQMLDLFLEKLNIEEQIILVGNSFGGGVATAYALRYPDKVKALVLVDSVLSKKYRSTIFVKAHHVLYRNLISLKFIPVSTKKYLLHTYLGTPIPFLAKEEIGKKERMIKIPMDLTADYSVLSMPVYLLWGNKDYFVHPIKYARNVLKITPRGKLIEYDGSVSTIYKEPFKVVSIIEEVCR